ncbi:MAG: hypothetical protein ACI4TU_11605, partial [Candidatus Cryptobacteroides sp.]
MNETGTMKNTIHTILTLILAMALSMPLSAQYMVDETRDETVTSMGKDKMGRLLFSTLRGLYSYDGKELISIVSDENVNSFFMEDDGTIWYCGQNYIGRVDKTRNIDRFYLQAYALSGIVPLPERKIAFSHISGVSLFDMDSLKVIKTETCTNSQKSELKYDKRTKSLWLSSEDMLKAFDMKINLRLIKSIPYGARVNSFILSRSDNCRLIIATTLGLYAIDNDYQYRQIAKDKIGDDNILFISSSDDEGVTIVMTE